MEMIYAGRRVTEVIILWFGPGVLVLTLQSHLDCYVKTS